MTDLVNGSEKEKLSIDNKKKKGTNGEFLKTCKKQKGLIIMSSVFIIYIAVFYYVPIWGWLMAFQDYKPALGISGSKFVGLKHFKDLFSDETFVRVLRNTLGMSFLNITFGFVTAITLAVFLNEVRNMMFKKVVQTISYLPHFISWVVAASLVYMTLSTDGGILNTILVKLHILDLPVLWLGKEKYFWWIIALSNVWKEVGWNAIIYLAAMTAIDPSLYEAASIDGAGRLKRIFKITIPGIMPTVKILLIMQCGWILNAGFEQQLLLGNSMVIRVSEVLDIFVLKYGIAMNRYSFATAAGIFKSLVSIILLFAANTVAKKFGDEGLL
ncbi:ABC transporter permease [Clostridium grantii]|uniref:Putative aldouronate transport system permease protein n=1 Tax=Clostridium grantii DSM 8605 TaxID=1121316 RepID=A0A1M5VVQ1_9CLOT|nr:ABC transporter permease subunit [Clostridium grantii]SHH79270.1 putative aldouronate transport system permease protein [Clostridium grantii DSM 8605]